jgi:uroporphyrinogen III methyltransferase / synthase
MNIQSGVVYLAGSGPGDVGLLTLRAHELLRGCNCIVYDALVSPEIMALANPDAERIYVGKRGNQHAYEQDEINALLAKKSKEGKAVLRFKGGDPYLFGRGAEEALHLLELGIPVEVVPGVTAGIAAPAYAGIPVTHREHASAVAFVTGHEDPTKPESMLDWAALSKIGTLCFYMGVKNLGRNCAQLAKHLPLSTPVAVIQWGTTPRQKSVAGTLETIEARVKEAGITAPALTVVGEVVKYREPLNFFERRPLFGKQIVVTRARAQASELTADLQALGATVHEFPTIRIDFTRDETFAKSITELSEGKFDWLVLTSVNGIDAVFAELERQGLDARAIKSRVAVIGTGTFESMLEHGVRADLIPPQFVAETVVESLQTKGEICGKRFLLARADIARSDLPAALKAQGGEPVDVVAYKTVLETEGQEQALAALETGGIDAVTFTSSSTARNFVEILGAERLKKFLANSNTQCLSIGPITSKTMKEVGLPLHGEAKQHDIPGLVELLRTTFRA